MIKKSSLKNAYLKKPIGIKSESVKGGLRNIFDSLIINPIKRGIENELSKEYNPSEGSLYPKYRKRGGAEPKKANPTPAQLKKVEELRAKMATNVKPKKTPEQLEALKQKRLEISIWKKSREGKNKLGEINELNNDEKLAYKNQQTRKGKQDYDEQMAKLIEQQAVIQERKEAKQEREWAEEERLRAWNEREDARLAAEAKKGDFWDVATGKLIDVTTGLLPKPIGAIAKGVANEGVKALKGLGVPKKKVGLSLSETRRQPLDNQHPEIAGNVELDKMLTYNIFNYARELLANNMRQEMAYSSPIVVSGGGKPKVSRKTGSKKYNKKLNI